MCESRGGLPELPVPNQPDGFSGRKATRVSEGELFFPLLLLQRVWNLRNKVKRKSRRLIPIEESSFLFDLSVDLSTSVR